MRPEYIIRALRPISRQWAYVSVLILFNTGLCHPAYSSPETGEPTRIYIRGANPDYQALGYSPLGQQHEISEKEINNTGAYATDILLKQLPSFSLFRRSPSTAGHPTTQGVSLRGTGASGASRTLVLLDGVPINDPFGGWVNWSRVPAEALIRVRVQENWGSPHFSMLGLGSVIELQTAEPLLPEQELSARLGTQETALATLKASIPTGRSGTSLFAQGFTTAGYKVVSAPQRGPIDTDANSQNLNVIGKHIRYFGSSSLYVTGSGFSEDRSNGTPLTENDGSTFQFSTGGRSKNLGGDLSFDLFGAASDFSSTFSSQAEDRISETPAVDQFDVPGRQLGAQFDWSIKESSKLYFEGGGDLLLRTGESHELFRFSEGAFQMRRDAEAKQSAVGAYLFSRYLAADDFTLDLFFRINGYRSYDLALEERELTSNETVNGFESDGAFKTLSEPRVQLSYRFDQQLSARAAVTRSYRIPTINELVRPFRVRNDITAANRDLSEESLTGIDLELTYDSAPFTISVTPYISRIEDVISNVTVAEGPGLVEPCGFVPMGGTCRQRRNIERAVTGGAQAELQLELDKNHSLRAEYLFTQSSIDSQNIEVDGNELPQLPRHVAALTAAKVTATYTASLQARYTGTQYENDTNTILLEPYITLDAYIALPLTPDWEVFIRGENLTGNRYEVGKSQDGVTTVGPQASLVAGVRVRL
ncbi:MAG: TonB-dependent receptor [Deltaproteobacteria bacterium]|nr:TonB-dependent receptor [Deltaproteobacteria bacterium]